MAAETYTSTVLIKVVTPGRSYEKSLSFSAESAPIEIEIDVPDESTDLEVLCAIDFSALKLLYIEVDGVLTIETNSGDAADDTITMGGDDEEVYLWTEEDLDTVKITADTTKLFLTNASGATVRFRLVALQDITP